MERTYTYEEKRYRYKVVYIGCALAAILVFSLVRAALTLSPFWLFVALVAAYGAANTFLTKSNPRQITVSDGTITFRSYGEKTFTVSKLTRFRVRLSTAGYQVYVRAADSEGHRGRFWVTYALFSEKEDLLKEFDYLERRVHPDSLRMSGRSKQGASRPEQAGA